MVNIEGQTDNVFSVTVSLYSDWEIEKWWKSDYGGSWTYGYDL